MCCMCLLRHASGASARITLFNGQTFCGTILSHTIEISASCEWSAC